MCWSTMPGSASALPSPKPSHSGCAICWRSTLQPRLPLCAWLSRGCSRAGVDASLYDEFLAYLARRGYDSELAYDAVRGYEREAA